MELFLNYIFLIGSSDLFIENSDLFLEVKHMNFEITFEIAWRKELLQRLQVPMNTLTRKLAKEQELKLKRLEELQQYSSPQEAQDAYGYGYITWEEYEAICQGFEVAENTVSPVEAAKDELQEIILRLEADIRHFRWTALSDEEKAEIEKRNSEWRDDLAKRKKGKSNYNNSRRWLHGL